jgi:hypothetical protein
MLIFSKQDLLELHLSLEASCGLFRQQRWVINGKLVMVGKFGFWEDNWVGNSSLAIQYWKLYRFVNAKNKSVPSLWDGIDLKCTFRRTGDIHMLELWEEVCQLASTISFSEEEDSLIWQFSSNGVHSVQSLYTTTTTTT